MFQSDGAEFHIFTDAEFSDHIVKITEQLEQCRQTGYFDSFDGKKLYYECFLSASATACVVMVHGLSEFTRKHYELIYYFLQQGYHAFIFDQRCHGYSERLTDRDELIHVDDFNDYVQDLRTFIDTVVLQFTNLPLYLFSYSMGGAVAAMYLSQAPSEKVEKAVLAAPLFVPDIGGTPFFVAKLGVCAKGLLSGPKSQFDKAKRFNPEQAVLRSNDKSRNRFLHNLGLRRDEPKYQSTPLTTGWINNSFHIFRDIKRKKLAEKIAIPVLLISAEKDDVVKTKPHYAFAKRCGNCRMTVIKDSAHSFMTDSQKNINEYVSCILDYYKNA